MKTITENNIMIFDEDDDPLFYSHTSSKMMRTPGLMIGHSLGHEIRSYVDLLKKLARLNYYNSRFKLLFRGQEYDYPISSANKGSNLYPSILRTGMTGTDPHRKSELVNRFKVLDEAEKLLVDELKIRELKNNPILTWAILQHYEVCRTPLLDVTPSLQTALSFAIGDRDDGVLYVLAFPLLNGPVSVSIESNTQIVDLSQYCPPEALRPHFQNGMLASDFPIYRDREGSDNGNGFIANNFCCRLLTKLTLVNCREWVNEGFTTTLKSILYPNSSDEWYDKTENVKRRLGI